MTVYSRTVAGIVLMSLMAAGILLAPPLLAEESLRDKIDEIVQAEIRLGLFSGTVVVAENGRVVYAAAVGEASKEYGVANTLKTRFNISSVQKCFVATVIMQLVQAGEISLDDSLSRYFPDCPFETADRIRIRNLLNHSSGLGDYRDSEQYQMQAESFASVDEVLPFVYADTPTFEPGESYQYSNTGVLLLKAIIERVTGMNLGQNLVERIFVPVGMDGTALFVGGDILADRATGHERADDGQGFVRVTGEPAAYCGGGIYTTGLDLLAFDQALYGEMLLDDRHKELMFTPDGPHPAVAYGWFVVPFGGTTVVMHSGGSGGYSTEFRRYPEKGYTIVVNSNYGGGAGFELTNAVEALLLGLPYDLASETTLRHARGMDLQGAEKYREALELFAENIATAEPHLPSLYQAARTRILGEFEQRQALELLDRYIELAGPDTQPSIAAAWWRKGVVYEQLTNQDRAIECYRQSLELDPALAQALEALDRLGVGR